VPERHPRTDPGPGLLAPNATHKTDDRTLPFEEITFEKPDFPFKLCTTTFIYPADWVANARALGGAFDELELLLFESARPDSLPTAETIRTLAGLSQDLKFTWNVHLPIDIYPAHPDRSARRQAAEVVKRVIDLTAPLTPTTHTLHLPGLNGRPDRAVVRKWRGRLHETLEQIVAAGIPGRQLTIENLPEYPLELALPLIEAFDLEVCLDLGHLLVGGASPAKAFEMFWQRVTLLHIHGTAGERDHRSLDRLPAGLLALLMQKLHTFSGVVSLEVFSKEHLLASLDCLLQAWESPLHGRVS